MDLTMQIFLHEKKKNESRSRDVKKCHCSIKADQIAIKEASEKIETESFLEHELEMQKLRRRLLLARTSLDTNCIGSSCFYWYHYNKEAFQQEREKNKEDLCEVEQRIKALEGKLEAKKNLRTYDQKTKELEVEKTQDKFNKQMLCLSMFN
jgi:predicted  nucleic acid-binding Zn-ribbon protein